MGVKGNGKGAARTESGKHILLKVIFFGGGGRRKATPYHLYLFQINKEHRHGSVFSPAPPPNFFSSARSPPSHPPTPAPPPHRLFLHPGNEICSIPDPGRSLGEGGGGVEGAGSRFEPRGWGAEAGRPGAAGPGAARRGAAGRTKLRGPRRLGGAGRAGSAGRRRLPSYTGAIGAGVSAIHGNGEGNAARELGPPSLSRNLPS